MDSGWGADTRPGAEEERRALELADLRSLLQMPQGVRVLRRLLARAGFFRRSFTGNSYTFFLEGERSIALWLFREICYADPEARCLRDLFVQQEVVVHGDRGERAAERL